MSTVSSASGGKGKGGSESTHTGSITVSPSALLVIEQIHKNTLDTIKGMKFLRMCYQSNPDNLRALTEIFDSAPGLTMQAILDTAPTLDVRGVMLSTVSTFFKQLKHWTPQRVAHAKHQGKPYPTEGPSGGGNAQASMTLTTGSSSSSAMPGNRPMLSNASAMAVNADDTAPHILPRVGPYCDCEDTGGQCLLCMD